MPDQPPEATTLVALVDVQVSVELLPEIIVVGLAVNVRVGGFWCVVTVTVTLLLMLPPGPVAVKV